jgi:hypothetical protein
MKLVRILALALACGALTTADALAVPPFLVLCPTPPQAADYAADALPSAASEPEDLENDCESLCAKKWFAACKAAVGAARKCQGTMIAKHAALVLASCKTDPDDESVDMCRASIKEQVQSLKQNLKENHAQALGCCSYNVSGCTNICQGEAGELQICDNP